MASAIIPAFSNCSNGTPPAGKTNATNTNTDNSIVVFSSKQLVNAGLTLGRPETRETHAFVKVSGVIDVPPQNIVSVSLPLGGYLKKTTMLPGSSVQKGSVLATIEDQQYIQLQQDYLTSESKLSYLEAEYSRQETLNSTKAVSDKTFQLAKAEVESQRILRTALAEKLRLIGIVPEKLTGKNISRAISIYSPISGYVTKVNANTGKYLNPTDILFELVDPSSIHLSLTVFENDAAAIFQGQKVTCYTAAHPEKKYQATVHLVNRNIGSDRSTVVHCHIIDPGKELIPGLYMSAEIQINSKPLQCLPVDAIVKWQNENYIFYQISDTAFKMYKVKTGMADESYVPILDSIPQAKIVTSNAFTLLSKKMNSTEE